MRASLIAAAFVSLLAVLSALPPASAQQATPSGFAMLDPEVGVVVTGLDGIPFATAEAIVAGFIGGLNESGASIGTDLLNAKRVLIVRGYPAAVRGQAEALVIDWRVSIDGGVDLGALYSMLEQERDWGSIGLAEAEALGRDAATRFRKLHFTEAFLRSKGYGGVLVE